MWKASRELSRAESNVIVGFLHESGKLQLSAAQSPYSGGWRTGIASPAPNSNVVLAPARIDGIDFIFGSGTSAGTLLDNLDQRMVVALYRLTRWINSSTPDITAIRHLGIGHGSGPPNDCHNQGRALDLSGVDGTSAGTPFQRNVKRDWGDLPGGPGVTLRLNPATDRLGHDLFRTSVRFGTLECECKGIGAANTWPPKVIGDPGGFVIHPDYVDSGSQPLRAAHQDHIHMQVGPTRA